MLLDARLSAALSLIRAETHADIGSDHAHLPIRLIQTGRVKQCVVVELNTGPLAHAQQNVARAGLSGQINVRHGNGFAPLQAGEVQSASLCGMGTNTILKVLSAAHLPPALVLQPNDSARALRVWAQQNGFHVQQELLATGYWTYAVLRLERRAGPDPAYSGLPLGAALRYGPHLLREASALLRGQIEKDIERLTPLAAPRRPAQAELQDALAALAATALIQG